MSQGQLVDWTYFEANRRELGPAFVKILGYYREDGAKSLAQIEQAMRDQQTVALVIPSHTLKGESRQFGAEAVANISEKIEMTARHCIETHRFPDELIPDVVELRRLWDQTIQQLDQAVSPLMQRGGQGGGFGKKQQALGGGNDAGQPQQQRPGGINVINQSFGRI